MQVDVQIWMHVLRFKSFLFCGVWFIEGVGDRMYVDLRCLMYILKSMFCRFCKG